MSDRLAIALLGVLVSAVLLVSVATLAQVPRLELAELPAEDNREQPVTKHPDAMREREFKHVHYCVIPLDRLIAAGGPKRDFRPDSEDGPRCNKTRTHCIYERWVELGMPKRIRDLSDVKCFLGNGPIRQWLADPARCADWMEC